MSCISPLDYLDPRLKLICDTCLGDALIPGASIAMVVKDKGYHYGYGVKSINSQEPVAASTSFNIGSCSKAFVSTALASLVADDLLKWDDPITKYVPGFQLYNLWVTKNATLRDLSGNRLGLPRAGLVEFGMNPEIPAAYLFERLKYTQPIFPFRDRFTYVNAGHTATAVAAGRITGKGFLQTLKERILLPLGMTGTSGGRMARDEITDVASWHVILRHRAVEIDPIYTDQYLGGGGMVVSGADAVQWLRLHLNGGAVDGRRIIDGTALQETHTPQAVARPGIDNWTLFYPRARMAAYALGWGVSDFEGHPLIAHSGSDLGVTAMTLLLPRSGIGIAVYCNATSDAAIVTAYAMAATLLGLPARDWKAYFETFRPAPPKNSLQKIKLDDLSPYVGTYLHAADGPLVIESDGVTLKGSLKNGYRMNFTLVPEESGRFSICFMHPEWQAAADSHAAPYLIFTMGTRKASQVELVAPVIGRVFDRVSDTEQ